MSPRRIIGVYVKSLEPLRWPLDHVAGMLKDTENYPFIGDVIDQLKIGRTEFYRYFPTDRIKQLRAEHSDATQA